MGGLSVALPALGAAVGSGITVGIRPENVIAQPATAKRGANATLVQDVDMGMSTRLTLSIGPGPTGAPGPDGGELLVYADVDAEAARGLGHPRPERWNVELPPQAIHAWLRD